MAPSVLTAKAWPSLLAAAITLCDGELSFSEQIELLCNFFPVNYRKMSLSFCLEFYAALSWV